MSVFESAKRLSGAKPGASTTVSVCATCRTASSSEMLRVGEMMLAALAPVVQEQVPDVVVRTVQCLGVCNRPATVAVSAQMGYALVFGDLDPQSGPAAIVAFVKSYRDADYGFVPRASRPELLRTRLVARIPSVLWSPKDGRPPA